jgi:hypothetical protein
MKKQINSHLNYKFSSDSRFGRNVKIYMQSNAAPAIMKAPAKIQPITIPDKAPTVRPPTSG